jgi:hypothetical protein
MYQFLAREIRCASPLHRQVQHSLELKGKIFENLPTVVSMEPDILYRNKVRVEWRISVS